MNDGNIISPLWQEAALHLGAHESSDVPIHLGVRARVCTNSGGDF